MKKNSYEWPAFLLDEVSSFKRAPLMIVEVTCKVHLYQRNTVCQEMRIAIVDFFEEQTFILSGQKTKTRHFWG